MQNQNRYVDVENLKEYAYLSQNTEQMVNNTDNKPNRKWIISHINDLRRLLNYLNGYGNIPEDLIG